MTEKPRVLIIEARFYVEIADGLRRGITAELETAGVEWEVIEVPGVFEVPVAMRLALRAMEIQSASHRYAGFVSAGCVIRGETDHYDHICREASRALMDLSTTYSVAHGFGILTCETYEQAAVRADPARKNKGRDAALACLRLMELKKAFRLVPR